MKYTMMTALSAGVTLMILHALSSAATESLSIDRVVGEVAEGKVVAATRIELYIRLVHIPDPPQPSVVQSTNAFVLYSPDSATWSRGVFVDTFVYTWPPPSTVFDTTYYGKWIDPQNLGPWRWLDAFYGLYSEIHVNMYSDHDNNPGTPDLFGEGADTIRYAGEASAPYTLKPGIFGYDGTAWLLLVDSASSSSIGKTICVDAVNDLAPQEFWRWVTYWEGNIDTIAPFWAGPYCFEIVADCCENLRGNINLDLQDTIDISDLTAFVGWMFKSGAAPPCMLEADVDGNDSHDIADVTYLVGYMFKSGPAPAGCP